jgi:hypothetical protein
MNFYLLPFAMLALLPFLLASFVLFDLLVRRLYTFHRASWEGAGSPHGFLYRPLETRRGPLTKPGSSLAMQHAAFVWLFRAPRWVSDDAVAKAWLTWFRLCVLAWNLGIVSVFALAILAG